MTYRVAQEEDEDGPWAHFRRVLGYPEMATQLNLVSLDVTFAFMLRTEGEGGWMRNGKRILGMAHLPRVTGVLSSLFEQLLEDAFGYWPDFLIVINAAWWEAASDREREILVFHELKHCGQELDQFGAPKFRKSDGRPVLAIVAHDVEEFSDVVARYGAWKSDLRDFFDAAARGPDVPNSEVSAGAPDLSQVIQEMAHLDGASPGDSPDDVF